MTDQNPDFASFMDSIEDYVRDALTLEQIAGLAKYLIASGYGRIGEAQVEWGYNYHPDSRIYTARDERRAREYCRNNGLDGFAFKRIVVRPEPMVGEWELLDGQQDIRDGMSVPEASS